MKTRVNLMFAVLWLLFVGAVSAQQPYISQDHKFSITFPETWTIKKSYQQNTLIKSVHRDPSGKIALIAIAVYQVATPSDIWEANAVSLFEGLKSENPGIDAALIGSGKCEINGVHALWSLIEVRAPALVSMRSLTYHLMHGRKLFRISASTDNDPDWFNKNRDTMKKSIETFRFVK